MMGVDVDSFSVLDMVPIGLFVLDRNLIIRFWNRTLESWTGLSREEVVGHHLGEQYPHLLELRYAGRLEEVFHLGTPAIFSSQLHPHLLPITLPGERQQQQNVTVTAVHLTGETWGALVAIEDVTDLVEQIGSYREMRDRALEEVGRRRQKEAELQKRNRELSVLHKATITITSSGALRDRLASVLEQILSYLGFEAGLIQLFNHKEEDGQLLVHSGLSPETVAAARAHTSKRGQQEQREHDDTTLEIEGYTSLFEATWGEQYLTIVHVPLVAEDLLVGSLVLMSAKMRAVDESQESLIESIAREIGTAEGKASLEARLVDAHEQANLYLDILTHDIGNTVTTIGGAADLLAVQVEAPDQGPLPQIQRGIGKVTEIIRNVSTIRHMHEQEIVLRPIRLDTLVRSEVDVVPDAQIIYEIPPFEVLADQLLGEVFTNLIGNSLKHGGKDVTIWIRARPVADGIECSVEDDGPGIPDEKKLQLFRRFETVEGRNTGHGLGLYITRSLVERYGGSCSVTDRVKGRPGEGLAVRILLQPGKASGNPCASKDSTSLETNRREVNAEVHRT